MRVLAHSGRKHQGVDASQGLPFSPFEVMLQNGKTDWKQNSAALADIFAYVVGLGGIQKDLLLIAIQDAYKAHGESEHFQRYGFGEAIPLLENRERWFYLTIDD